MKTYAKHEHEKPAINDNINKLYTTANHRTPCFNI